MSERATPETDAKERETLNQKQSTHAHYGWKHARRLERERDEALEALLELVRLQDLHDKIEHEKRSQLFRSADDLQSALNDYRTNKPSAWDRARAILAKAKP